MGSVHPAGPPGAVLPAAPIIDPILERMSVGETAVEGMAMDGTPSAGTPHDTVSLNAAVAALRHRLGDQLLSLSASAGAGFPLFHA